MRIGTSPRVCFVILISLLLGTAIGIFFQQFAVTEPLFKNFVDFSFSIKEINLLFIRFGLLFGIKINLGTIFGGIIGIFATK